MSYVDRQGSGLEKSGDSDFDLGRAQSNRNRLWMVSELSARTPFLHFLHIKPQGALS